MIPNRLCREKFPYKWNIGAIIFEKREGEIQGKETIEFFEDYVSVDQ